MTVKKSKIPELKVKLATTKDFSKLFDFFFTHFVEKDPEGNFGEPAERRDLLEIITHTGGAILRTNRIELTEGRMMCVPQYQFYHGGVHLNNHPGVFFYFEDIDKGALLLQKGQQTFFARISIKQISPPPAPPKN